MSTDYQRGYSKGYTTGNRNSDAANAKERARADQAVQRAERAEKQQGLGHCEDCQYWTRGGGGPRASACAWGICEMPCAAGTPWGAWACIDSDVRDAKLQTTPRFGCVVFMASNGAGAARQSEV